MYQTVGQSGIGISADVIRCTGSKLLQERFQLTGAKGAVQADREYIGMLHRSEKGFQSLPRQRTPSNIGNGHREHQGYMNSYSFHRLPCGKNSSLGIQRIKNSFYQQSIHTPFEQRFHLLTVGIGKFIVAQARKAGLFTSGLMEQVLFVGPTEPATKRGLSGVREVNSSATLRARRTAARFISRT